MDSRTTWQDAGVEDHISNTDDVSIACTCHVGRGYFGASATRAEASTRQGT
jgi:hypothetical protein